MMIDSKKRLAELVELSNWLGAPEQDCAILGEGNTSVRLDDSTFLVKASGTELRTLTDQGLLMIDLQRVLATLDEKTLDDRGIRE